MSKLGYFAKHIALPGAITALGSTALAYGLIEAAESDLPLEIKVPTMMAVSPAIIATHILSRRHSNKEQEKIGFEDAAYTNLYGSYLLGGMMVLTAEETGLSEDLATQISTSNIPLTEYVNPENLVYAGIVGASTGLLGSILGMPPTKK